MSFCSPPPSCTSARALPFPPQPPSPTSLPGLIDRFGDQQLILDKLVVQGNEIAIPATISASITFAKDGKASGSGGCNRFFGNFESAAPGQVKFGPIGATKMYCQDKMMVEDGLFQALQKVTRYTVDNIRLILQSEDGQYMARFYVPVK